MLAKLGANKTLVALVGAVVIPMAALFYLARLPGGGRGSLLAILLQVALVLVSVVLFGIFLTRLVEQMNARRVRSWLDTTEGQEWLAAMPDDERAEFWDRLDGKTPVAPGEGESAAQSPVDSADESR